MRQKFKKSEFENKKKIKNILAYISKMVLWKGS